MSDGIEAEPSLPAERSRRQLLSGGSLLGAAALVAGCTSKVKQPSNVNISPKTPGVKRDVELLNGLLRLEYESIYAYTACIPLLPQPKPPPKKPPKKASLFSPPPRPAPKNAPPPPLKLLVPLAHTAAQQFLTQELAHVNLLKGYIHQGGGHWVKTSPSYHLGHPRTKQEVLTLLHRTEEKLLQKYLWTIVRLSPSSLRGGAAAIMANHAQHSSILRLGLGLAPIPRAFLSVPE